jgi:hypothetical protein
MLKAQRSMLEAQSSGRGVAEQIFTVDLRAAFRGGRLAAENGGKRECGAQSTPGALSAPDDDEDDPGGDAHGSDENRKHQQEMYQAASDPEDEAEHPDEKQQTGQRHGPHEYADSEVTHERPPFRV